MEVAHSTRRWLDSVGDRLGITPYAFVVGVLAVAVAGAAGWWAFAAPDPPPAEDVLPRVEALGGSGHPGPVAAPVTDGPTTTVDAVIMVHVDGAVMVPGVHELAPGSRVFDAIEAAQGLRPDADRSRLNLAAVVGDGPRVWVPLVGEEEPAVIAITGGAGGSGPLGVPIVDLNAANVVQLETLPGIGPAIAAAIVSHRQEHGPFRRVDDLLEVAGIGPSKLDRLEPLVTV